MSCSGTYPKARASLMMPYDFAEESTTAIAYYAAEPAGYRARRVVAGGIGRGGGAYRA
jgi:hypothetical protein